MKKLMGVLLLAALVGCAPEKQGTVCGKQPLSACPQKAKMNRFIDDLMAKMTLEEKVGQLNLPTVEVLTGIIASEGVEEKIKAGQVGAVLNVRGIENCRKLQEMAVKETRLGIPLIFGLDVIHGFETIFPIPLAMASSWNPAAVERASRVAAVEASAGGINWTYSPMVDIARDARWGRVAEGSGEDPYLGAVMAKAYVRGYQGDFSRDDHIMACVKHYALYGAPDGGRDYNTTDMSRQRMFNEYMLPYQAAVDAGVGSVMTSFNEIEGIPATAHKWLIEDVLRKQWGFHGFVVTDYASIDEMVVHGIGPAADCAALALAAGTDMDMVADRFRATLPESLKKGKVTMKMIDDACRRILEAKYLLGLFDDPYRFCNPKRAGEIYSAQNRAASREVAAESMVLLKNAKNVLPLDPSKKIAVIGPIANEAKEMYGMWSFPTEGLVKPVSVLDGLKKALGDKVANLTYAPGCNLLDDPIVEKVVFAKSQTKRIPRSDKELIAEAVKVAKEADIIVAALGETADMSGEGASRLDLTIPRPQKALLEELVKLGKPVVLVLFTGRPLVLTWEDKNVDAILNAWFAGSEAGDAISDVLLGNVNPSGKLPISFPYHASQVPLHYNHKNTGRPVEPFAPYVKYQSNFQDAPNVPLYPFGFGLSYATFSYGDVKLSSNALAMDDKIQVTVDVKNTGEVAGAEVVQLYIRDIYGTVTRPVKELKQFKKLTLKPGETQSVTFDVTVADLKFYNHALEYVAEPGDFEVMIGGNSRDVKKKAFTLR